MLSGKLVIELNEWNQNIEELDNILKNILQYIHCSQYDEVGNDIKYTLNEIKKFKSKLRKLIDEEASKYQSDIFGNQISRFKNYKYAELIFSEDLKLITSIRLLGMIGRKDSKRPIRYVLFNVPNIFDLNLINIASNIKNIIKEFKLKNINEKEFVNFLNKYFTPTPDFHAKENRDPICALSDLNQQIDSMVSSNIFGKSLEVSWSKPKTLQEWRDENILFESFKFKNSIYQNRKNSYMPTTPLGNLLREGQSLRDRIGNNANPLDCLMFLFNNFFGKYDVCHLIQAVIKNNIPDPRQFLMQLSLGELFRLIDGMKASLKDKIYNVLMPNLMTALSGIETFISASGSSTVCLDVLAGKSSGLKVSELLLDLKNKYPDLYVGIEQKFEELFSRDQIIDTIATIIDLALLIDFCDFKLPAFSLPVFTIRNLFADFSLDLEQFIFDLLCALLSQITSMLLDLLFNMNKFDDFFNEIFMDFLPKQSGNEEEKWQKYIDYSFNLILKTAQLKAEGQPITDPELLSYLVSAESLEGVRVRTRPRDNPEECSTDVPAVTNVNIDAVIDDIKNYTYCLGRENFSVTEMEDSKSLQSLKLISEIKRRDEQAINEILLPSSREELSASLYEMIKQIESVFTSRELVMLINGNYTETMAQIIRIICEINFPKLANKIDPIKYFTMIGKVFGSLPERAPN